MIEYCPCGNNKIYTDCCEPNHLDINNAKTAEELMKSRYVAFTQGNIDFLMHSHHSKTRPLKEKKNMLTWMQSVNWLGLVILDKEKGQSNDSSGIVEFKALYMENDETNYIHEKSIFERENGHWVYVSGSHF